MSRPQDPTPVKPLAALFAADKRLLAEAAGKVEDVLGVIDYASELLAFDQTDYYHAEMGGPLYKRLVAAEALMDPTDLVGIKHECWRLEEEFAAGSGRLVNIDPGYLASGRVVLATGKDASHRIYLGRGVYADLSLVYRHGRWETLPWTYPDYAEGGILDALSDLRKKYMQQLKTVKQEER